jgi:CubicO group peptidase (beta-lactamase class C family)
VFRLGVFELDAQWGEFRRRLVIFAATAVLLAFDLSGCAAPAPVHSTTAAGDAVDRYIEGEMRQRGIPGVAVGVVENGKIIKLNGYGVATLDHDVPVTPRTVFSIASVDKQFTALAIMLLVEERKVSLDDTIDRYFTEAPATWRGIRVRHLLTHTSGLGDAAQDVADAPRVYTRYTTGDLLQSILRTHPDFTLGTRWRYSGAAFFLLQLVVERVSGVPYHQFLTTRVLQPLEMSDTRMLRPLDVRRHRATHYERNPAGTLQTYPYLLTDWDLWNDIGTTITDFAKWASALDAGRLLGPASFKHMWTPAVLSNGDPVQFQALTESFNSYGFGWILGAFRGHATISHAGYAGAAILRLPDDRVSVVVLSNLTRDSGSNPQGLALGIAGFYVPEVSWLALSTSSDPAPGVTEQLLSELRRLGDGRPTLDRYTPTGRPLVEAAAAAFQAEARRLGSLESLTLLETHREPGAQLLLCRGNYSQGRLFLRIRLTDANLIDRIQVDWI